MAGLLRGAVQGDSAWRKESRTYRFHLYEMFRTGKARDRKVNGYPRLRAVRNEK